MDCLTPQGWKELVIGIIVIDSGLLGGDGNSDMVLSEYLGVPFL
jgi:hypothetical protein